MEWETNVSNSVDTVIEQSSNTSNHAFSNRELHVLIHGADTLAGQLIQQIKDKQQPILDKITQQDALKKILNNINANKKSH